jgi:hypothetical protein
MPNDSYYPQLYKCPKCGKVEKYYVWKSEVGKAKHVCLCGARLGVKSIHFEEVSNVPAIRTPTVNRYYSGKAGKKEILEKYLHKGAVERKIKAGEIGGIKDLIR